MDNPNRLKSETRKKNQERNKGITREPADTKQLIRENYEEFYINIFDRLQEMKQIFENTSYYNSLWNRLLNSPIYVKEIAFVICKLQFVIALVIYNFVICNYLQKEISRPRLFH